MRRTRREDSEPSGAPPWMCSYADLVQLLLTFFVLLFALSSIDAYKFRQAVLSLQGALGVLPAGAGVMDLDELPMPRPQVGPEQTDGEGATLEGVMRELRTYLHGNALSDNVHLQLTERGLVVSFMDKVLFDRGDAELRPEAREVLSEVAVMLGKLPNDVRIEGHTCDLPIRTTRFPSNWELSTSRACAVLRYFIEKARQAPERFSAMGYGEYKPKMPNTDEPNRALNRRVDVVILRERERLLLPDGDAS